MDEMEFQLDMESEWAGHDVSFPTTGYAIIREGYDEGTPWAAGQNVTVFPLNPTPVSVPRPTRRERLRRWWYWNRPTVHRGPCDHEDCG